MLLPALLATFMVTTPRPSELTLAQGWTVFPGDATVSEGGRHVHDPTIVEISGSAFCFSTSGDGFTVVRSSKDLMVWKEHGPIFSEQPAWLAKRFSHRSIWAPDIVVLKDRVRMYYSASNFGRNDSVIGLAENLNFDPKRPTEGWVDRGLVIETKAGDDKNTIDAEVVVDTHGSHWMYFGSYWSGIYVAALDESTGKLKGGVLTCVAKNTEERGNPIEGAAVLRKGNFYYLFVSYGLAAQGIRSTYRIMVGRSKSPTGPFLDRSSKAMTDGGHVDVLKTSPPMISPGHCDVLTLKDGRTVMPYHYYDARRAWGGDNWGLPTLEIRELLWDHDGWPLPGLPVLATRPEPDTTAGPKSLVGKWVHQADFRDPETIEFRADGTIVGGSLNGKWDRAANDLILTWTSKSIGNAPFVDHVQLAHNEGYYVGRDAQGRIIRGYRAGSGG